MLRNFIIVFFCAVCLPSELRNVAIARMKSIERKGKRDGVKRKDSDLFCLIFILGSKNIISDLDYYSILLPATKDLVFK